MATEILNSVMTIWTECIHVALMYRDVAAIRTELGVWYIASLYCDVDHEVLVHRDCPHLMYRWPCYKCYSVTWFS